MHPQPSDEMLRELGLVRSPHGYYEAAQKPDREVLQAFYRDMYFQTDAGHYSQSYAAPELAYLRGQVALRHRFMQTRGWLAGGTLSLLDVGCGEGHALSYFAEQGWSVRGLDFSVEGCRRLHPECLPWLIQGDVFESLARLVDEGACHDVVFLDNVLEHVIDPPGLLRDLHRVVRSGGVLVVDVPNDFSPLQMTALAGGWIDRAFWVSIPQHLSYFSAASLSAVGEACGWQPGAIQSDFPIDWFLANPNSNYVAAAATGTGKGSPAGKGAHAARIAIENMLRESDMDRLNDFYVAMAAAGAGRSLVGYFIRP